MIHKKDTIVEHIGLEERILSHDKQLVKLETVLERVANNQDKMSASMETLALSMSKLAILEDNNKARFERVHRRIDDVVSAVEEADKASRDRKASIDKRLEDINFVFVAMKYPKLVALSLIGLYVFAISDVRDILMSVFRVVGV